MKIDLCKVFGVDEREEFKIGTNINPYRIYNNSLQRFDTYYKRWEESVIEFNYVVSSKIIRLPKKKEFTDDELVIMRNIPIEYEWMARDRDKSFTLFDDKPVKSNEGNYWVRCSSHSYKSFDVFNHLFKSITGEDEEPVYIDDYVNRQII